MLLDRVLRGLVDNLGLTSVPTTIQKLIYTYSIYSMYWKHHDHNSKHLLVIGAPRLVWLRGGCFHYFSKNIFKRLLYLFYYEYERNVVVSCF